jgi:hypothetical protein
VRGGSGAWEGWRGAWGSERGDAGRGGAGAYMVVTVSPAPLQMGELPSQPLHAHGSVLAQFNGYGSPPPAMYTQLAPPAPSQNACHAQH